MNISLLAPLALAASLLVAVPIFLHLIHHRKVPIQDFPALRFLLQAQKRLRKRSRVRDKALLLFRLLALLLLVLAAASPILTYQREIPAGAELKTNVIFLLDRSLSMGYQVDGEQTVFNLAKAHIDTVLDRMPDGSRAGLIVFDQWPEDRVNGLSHDLTRVRTAAKRAELGFGKTDLRSAILAGLRALMASPEGGGDLYVLTDLTDSSLIGNGTLDLPEQLEGKVRLVLPELAPEVRSNHTVVSTKIEGSNAASGTVKVVAQVRSEGIEQAEEISVDFALSGEVIARGFADVTADGTLNKQFTVPASQDLRGRGELILADDALLQDNIHYFRLSQRRELKVLLIDGDPGMNLTEGESYFLDRALSPGPRAGSQITPVITGVGAVPHLSVDEYAVVFLLNVADPAPLSASLQAFVEAGGALFISCGDQVSPERYNRALRGLLPAALGETISAAPDVTGETAPSLAYPPVGHPVFSIFREAGAGVFGTTRFYKVAPTAPRLKPDAEVLLKYSTGLPALLSREIGKGRVFLFTSTMDRSWSDFPMRSIFLPFVQESVHYLARNPVSSSDDAQFLVGQTVPLTVPNSTGELEVQTPDGQMLPLVESEATQGSDGTMLRFLFREASMPGAYEVFETVKQDGSTQKVRRADLAFAVNVSHEESELKRMDIQRLADALPGIAVVLEGQGEEGQSTVTVERKQKLAHFILWAALLFMIIEGLLANRRHGQEQELDPLRAPNSAAP